MPRRTTWLLRSVVSISECSKSHGGNSATYSALLELTVVAGLLHAVKQFLDQRGVVGLGPGSGLVLSGRHCGVVESI